jgi:phospholipase/lecithinase/hemolysin
MIWDVLEERTLPSHGGLPIGPVGVLGDSYSDAYQFSPPHRMQARSWVEILSRTRGVPLGAFSTQSWGDSRGQGFEFDWAHVGDTSTNMIQNQLPGLLSQVASGRVKYVSIFIGSNDFSPVLMAASNGKVPVATALNELNAELTRLEANLTTAINRILAANPTVKIAVANLFDLSTQPYVPKFMWRPQAQTLIAALSQATQQYNAMIASLAAGNSRIAVVDLAGMMANLVQEGGASGWVQFGGTAINMRRPGDGIQHAFLADRVHFGTVVHGMIADAFIDAYDSLGAHLNPLTPQQIVRLARQIAAEEA